MSGQPGPLNPLRVFVSWAEVERSEKERAPDREAFESICDFLHPACIESRNEDTFLDLLHCDRINYGQDRRLLDEDLANADVVIALVSKRYLLGTASDAPYAKLRAQAQRLGDRLIPVLIETANIASSFFKDQKHINATAPNATAPNPLDGAAEELLILLKQIHADPHRYRRMDVVTASLHRVGDGLAVVWHWSDQLGWPRSQVWSYVIDYKPIEQLGRDLREAAWRCDHEDQLLGLARLGNRLFHALIPPDCEAVQTLFVREGQPQPDRLVRFLIDRSIQLPLGLVFECDPDQSEKPKHFWLLSRCASIVYGMGTCMTLSDTDLPIMDSDRVKLIPVCTQKVYQDTLAALGADNQQFAQALLEEPATSLSEFDARWARAAGRPCVVLLLSDEDYDQGGRLGPSEPLDSARLGQILASRSDTNNLVILIGAASSWTRDEFREGVLRSSRSCSYVIAETPVPRHQALGFVLQLLVRFLNKPVELSHLLRELRWGCLPYGLFFSLYGYHKLKSSGRRAPYPTPAPLQPSSPRGSR